MCRWARSLAIVAAAAGVLGVSAPAGAAPSHRIHDIQGMAHRSPLEHASVTEVPGVVTAAGNNGFWFEDPVPDSDPRTSEGLFVFTTSVPAVAVGDSVLVSGTVTEFRPGGSGGAANLTTTEIATPGLAVQVASGGNPLPVTTIGAGGRLPPTTVIEDDAAGGDVENAGGSFDVDSDGIDFWESLEGMRLQVATPRVVGPTNAFGEIPVLADGIAGAGPPTARGGILVQPGDFNPERLILDDEVLVPAMPRANVGDTLSGVTGVLDYSFGNFKLQVTAVPGLTGGGLAKEAAGPAGAAQLAMATFNVENLDPSDPQSRFDGLAAAIVNDLRAPDLIAVEEIQDDNGPVNDAVVGASATFNQLVAAVSAAGGPAYQFRQIDPVDDADGGEPGGNIRVGFLFRTDRGLSFVDRPGGGPTTAVAVNPGPTLSVSPGRIDPANAAFANSRKPLAGEFEWQGRRLFAIGVHFNSKGGDQPLFGRFQPPVPTTETQRLAQATVVRDFIRQLLAADPAAAVALLGDVNDFEFSPVATRLEDGGAMRSLMKTLPANERYSYVFDGNSQTLDQMLASDTLAGSGAEYDSVHLNSEFADRLSDHDPQVARFTLASEPPPVVPESRRPVLLVLSVLPLAIVGLGLGRRHWHRSRRPEGARTGRSPQPVGRPDRGGAGALFFGLTLDLSAAPY